MSGRPRRPTLFPATRLSRSGDERGVGAGLAGFGIRRARRGRYERGDEDGRDEPRGGDAHGMPPRSLEGVELDAEDRKSTRLNSSHLVISYAVFCLKKKKKST